MLKCYKNISNSKTLSLPNFGELALRGFGDPGPPGEPVVFLCNKELKKFARTPSPDGEPVEPFGSNFLFAEDT